MTERVFFIYKTTRVKDGAFYIGKHSTLNLDDGYLGSGYRIKASVKAHGKGAHRREILKFGMDEVDLRRLEQQELTEDVLTNPLCLNLAPGGQGGNIGGGGFFSPEHKAAFHKGGGRATAAKASRDPVFAVEMSARKSAGNKAHRMAATPEEKLRLVTTQRLATEAAKLPAAKAKRVTTYAVTGHSKGANNPNYGRKWMNNGIINKGVLIGEVDQFLNNGYVMGRKGAAR
jgi:hypothetical protein